MQVLGLCMRRTSFFMVQEIMNHTTFDKKGDFKLLTNDEIYHLLEDDYSEGYKDQGSTSDLNTLLQDMVTKCEVLLAGRVSELAFYYL